MKIIFDFNRTLFNPDNNTLFEGVLDMLKRLSANHKLTLITRGKAGREKIVDKLNICMFFEEIIFTDKKTTELFKRSIEDPAATIIVGDRLEEEIAIGVELNTTTILISIGQDEKLVNVNPTHVIQKITDVEKIVKKK